ncbi:MAG: A/G-specific adenine glycosylase [Desulfobacterales bacterium]|nr:A/G-specific adenine glycosylase [Desulfobacterales bacterium]
MDWYAENCRWLPWRRTQDPYHIWVSEIMLQQTRVDTVIGYYRRFLRRFPDVADLAAAGLQDVLKLWEGLGYYARARNLHQAAGIVNRQYHGRVPYSRADFIALPGVGSYIAAAVLSIAYEQPYAAVDGNVKRVLSRIYAAAVPVNGPGAAAFYQGLADDLLERERPGIFNQAVMELGALVCRPAGPDCGSCPVRDLCMAQRRGDVQSFPVRKKRRSVPTYRLAAAVIRKKGRILIVCRPENGLLGGLWEFPGGEMQSGESPEDAGLRLTRKTVGLNTGAVHYLTRVKHAYTHFKVEADVLICDYHSGRVRLNGPADFRWISPRSLGRYPLTGMTRKFLPKLVKMLSSA